MGRSESAFAELARRALSFSALSARKNRSSGDSSRVSLSMRALFTGVGLSESVGGGEGSGLKGLVRGMMPGESGTDFAMKLGIGSEEGAGEAWKVAPAKAATEGILAEAELGGGVLRAPFMVPGEAVWFLDRFLLPPRCFDCVFGYTEESVLGVGLGGLNLRGVSGPDA